MLYVIHRATDRERQKVLSLNIFFFSNLKPNFFFSDTFTSSLAVTVKDRGVNLMRVGWSGDIQWEPWTEKDDESTLKLSSNFLPHQFESSAELKFSVMQSLAYSAFLYYAVLIHYLMYIHIQNFMKLIYLHTVYCIFITECV